MTFPSRASLAFTSSPSFPFSSLPSLISCDSGNGLHGNPSPSGCLETFSLPLSVMSLPVLGSMNTNVGIPLTLNFLDSFSCNAYHILYEQFHHCVRLAWINYKNSKTRACLKDTFFETSTLIGRLSDTQNADWVIVVHDADHANIQTKNMRTKILVSILIVLVVNNKNSKHQKINKKNNK